MLKLWNHYINIIERILIYIFSRARVNTHNNKVKSQKSKVIINSAHPAKPTLTSEVRGGSWHGSNHRHSELFDETQGKLRDCHPETTPCHPGPHGCHPGLHGCHPGHRSGIQKRLAWIPTSVGMTFSFLLHAVMKRKVMIFSVLVLLITLPLAYLAFKYQPKAEAVWTEKNYQLVTSV